MNELDGKLYLSGPYLMMRLPNGRIVTLAYLYED